MKKINRAASVAAAAAAIALPALAVATAQPAAAASRDGKCTTGEFCYYYNSGEKGSISDFTTSVSDLGAKQPSCYEFKGAGNGKGKCVKNNAASVWNKTSKTVTVYYNSGDGGATQSINAGAKADLSKALKNNNAAHRIGPAPAVATTHFLRSPPRPRSSSTRRAGATPARRTVTTTTTPRTSSTPPVPRRSPRSPGRSRP